ncbi:MAG: hypothetical protein AUJ72_02680 [Candidatus Omnitrophica bacterium CG1_02_46_14]|nr:MAG: hypothetical protein AUJ72_02680 [Candidatus Omnitrophica bacterium CG1_02_46_14]
MKENPIEGGVDPYFQVLSAAEAEILMGQILDRLFEEKCANTVWLETLSLFGETAIREALKKFYEMERAFGPGVDIFKRNDLQSIRKEALAQVLRSIQSLDESIDSRKMTEAESKLKGSLKELSNIFYPDQAASWESLEAILEAKKSLSRRIAKYKEAVAEIQDEVDRWVSLAVEKLTEPFKQEFEKICKRFAADYDEEKQAKGTYDFEDLLVKASHLLSGATPETKAVRERLRGHFLSILVDEYQDTSPLQNQLIELLKKKDNLFLVGDIQQSIYGFRFADPEMFHRKLLAEPSTARHIRLNENHRSRKELITFINFLFKNMGSSASFYPLEAKKNFTPSNRAAVSLLCVLREKEESGDLDKARVLEARSIAAAINEMRSQGIEYRDIAILFRSLTKSYLYEKELNDSGIPYALAKGGGFYEKPEILDFINFLKLIENPGLDIALAGVLRSPLVHLSDDALFWIAEIAKKEDPKAPLVSALDQISKIRGLTSADRQKLEDFKRLLDGLRKAKNGLTLSEILEKILKETVYDAKVLTRPDGRQTLANVLKLISLARTMEDKNIVGVGDFIRYAEYLREAEVIENEARLTAGSENVVTLSTIHAAKGLEFSSVIVADMGRQEPKGRKDNFLAYPGLGFGLKLNLPGSQEAIQDFSYSEIDKALKKKEAAEEERLLYVALTRAKESLVLSGSLNRDPASGEIKKNSSWMSRIVQTLLWNPKREGEGEMSVGGVALKIASIIRKPIKAALSESRLQSKLPISDREVTALIKRLQITTKAYDESEDHTVTDLLLASRETPPIFKKFLVGQDKAIGPDVWEVATPRNEFGTLYHKAMEYSILHRSKKIISLNLPPALFQTLALTEQTELKENVKKFWRGDLGQLVHEAKKCYTELPFIYKTPKGILRGQIDLVLQTRSGEWVIIDYKTNKISPNQKDALAKEYEVQIAIYAFVFMRLYGEIPRKGVLYFSTIDDSYEFQYTVPTLDAFEEKLNQYFILASSTTASADVR